MHPRSHFFTWNPAECYDEERGGGRKIESTGDRELVEGKCDSYVHIRASEWKTGKLRRENAEKQKGVGVRRG